MTDFFDLQHVPDSLRDVAEAVVKGHRTTVDRLRALVEIPSIAFAGHDPAHCVASADATEQMLRDAGMQDVRQLHVEGAPPFVFAQSLEAGPDAPSVLLYAHHDVQPIPNAEDWDSPPFQPTERDGRLYGRGTSDNKCGIAVHIGAIDAWLSSRNSLPVNLKVIIEGEEEVGSPNMEPMVAEHADLLRPDVVIICDLMNPDPATPSLTYMTRGISEVYITVRALRNAVHSGVSGPVPDALSGLIAVLASLKDEHGGSAVAGIADDARALTPAERERIAEIERRRPERMTKGLLLDGVQTVGDNSLGMNERMWTLPAITVLGIDVPRVNEATNQLVADARAKISIRIAPGQDPQRVARLVGEHLKAHVPWGMHCDITYGAGAKGWVTEPQGPAFAAAERALRAGFARDSEITGVGGTLPLLSLFEETYPAVPCLLTGVGDASSRAHGINESVDLAALGRATLAEAILLQELAGVRN